MLATYPSVFAIDHAALAELFDGNVVVEEKVDGSQFSFGLQNGELFARSKNVDIVLDFAPELFNAAIASIKSRAHLLKEGYTYRAEYLSQPKHNALEYARTPKDHLLVIDINDGRESYLSPEEKAAEAARIGLEVVPLLNYGAMSMEELRPLLDSDSFLGGSKVEGIVVKNYSKYVNKKAMLGKFVREDFAEINAENWRKINPSQGELVVDIIAALKTEARWLKAVQHLKDNDELTGSGRDIPALLNECANDVKKECEELIKDKLFAWAWPKIQRGVTNGFADWYKDRCIR